MIGIGDEVEIVKDFWQNNLVLETLMLFLNFQRKK